KTRMRKALCEPSSPVPFLGELVYVSKPLDSVHKTGLLGRPADDCKDLAGVLPAQKGYKRRRRESNPCTGLCRPLPKPLGHSAAGASSQRAASSLQVPRCRASERTTGFEPATLTLAR